MVSITDLIFTKDSDSDQENEIKKNLDEFFRLMGANQLRKDYEDTKCTTLKSNLSVNISNCPYLTYLCRITIENSATTLRYKARNSIDFTITSLANESILHYMTYFNQTRHIWKLISLGVRVNVVCKNANRESCVPQLTPLMIAVYNENMFITKILLSMGANVNPKLENNMTPLHLACFRGNLNLVKILIDAGADINAKTDQNITPLHYAVDFEHDDVVLHLLKKPHIDYDARSRCGYTQFHAICKAGKPAIAKAFMERDRVWREGLKMRYYWSFMNRTVILDLNTVNKEHFSPLHHSVGRRGFFGVSRALIDHGANVDKPTKSLSTPLHIATSVSLLPEIELLIRKGSSVTTQDKNGWTSLHYAVFSGNTRLVEMICKINGPAVNMCTVAKNTPLHFAARLGNDTILEMLLSFNADVNARDCTGWTPMHVAVANGHSRVVARLLANRARVLPEYERWETPLHMAVRLNHRVMVTNIIHHYHLEINRPMAMGITPLHLAAYHNHVELAMFLIKNGAYIDAKTDDVDRSTPLSLTKNEEIYRVLSIQHELFKYVANNDFFSVIRLLKSNSNVILNIRSAPFKTPLILAVHRKYNDIAEYLLRNGADPNVNDCKHTALHYAIKGKNMRAIYFLLKHGAMYTIPGQTPESIINYLFTGKIYTNELKVKSKELKAVERIFVYIEHLFNLTGNKNFKDAFKQLVMTERRNPRLYYSALGTINENGITITKKLREECKNYFTPPG